MGSKYSFTVSNTTDSRSHTDITASLLEDESFRPSSGRETVLSSQEYLIKCILDESSTKYLIAWEGPFQPTWEPKHCANPAAVRAWVATKHKRYVTADKYRNQRPLRTSRQVHQNPSGSASSPSHTQGSLESHSTLVSDAQSSYPSQPSQETVLSGSIFCPSIDSQGSQPSGIFSAHSQTQLLQESTYNRSSLSQSINTTEIESAGLSQAGGRFTPNTNGLRKRDLREIQETPPSRFVIDPDISILHSLASHTGIGDTPESSNATTERLIEFQTPIRPARVQDKSSLRTIPETIDQTYSSLPQPDFVLKSQKTFEGSPSFPAGSKRPQYREAQEAQESSSLHPAHDLAMASQASMNNSTPGSSSAHIPQIVTEAVRDSPSKSFLQNMQREREMANARIRPLRTISKSATPSSAGDIEPTAPPNVSEGLSPLSLRTSGDISGIEHAQESPVPFVAPQALLYNVDHPSTLPVLAETNEHKDDQGLELPQPSEPVIGMSGDDIAQSPDEETGTVQLAPLEFAIPLSMDSRVKDDYDITLSNESKNIKKFIEISNPDGNENYDAEVKSFFSKMQAMVEHLDNISTHPDLNLINQPVAAAPDVAREASWAEYSSSKFQFFGYFIDVAVNHDLHVIVMAKQGKTIDVLKNYFLGKDFTPFESSDKIGKKDQIAFRKELLSFEIRATNDEQVFPALKRPSLIVALDSSFSVEHPSVQRLRSLSNGVENLVPIVRLLIANTAEHIERCLPPGTDLNRLRQLVHFTVELSDKAGDLQDNALGVQEDAEETLAYLLSDPAAKEWKLPQVEALEIDTLIEDASNGDSEQILSADSPRQKRWLDNEMGDGPSKRQRTTPFQDITHISDSMGGLTQDKDMSISESQIPQQSVTYSAELENLRKALAESQARVQTMESNLATLQHRHETKHLILHETRQELEKALETGKRAETKLERQKGEILKLKDEKAALTKDLEEARNTIKSGGGLESDLEKAREEARSLTKDNSALQRTVQQERSQGEYTRQQYQNASSSAAQSAMEIRQLEDKVRDLETKASGEAARLKELKMKNDQQTHLARVEELEAALAAREEILTRKEEEVRELRKNRPSTRATSMQPRSPKCGPSRSASPAPNSISSAVRGSALKFRTEIS